MNIEQYFLFLFVASANPFEKFMEKLNRMIDTHTHKKSIISSYFSIFIIIVFYRSYGAPATYSMRNIIIYHCFNQSESNRRKGDAARELSRREEKKTKQLCPILSHISRLICMLLVLAETVFICTQRTCTWLGTAHTYLHMLTHTQTPQTMIIILTLSM